MVENTRSQDYKRLEEAMKASFKEVFDKLQAQDNNIAALNMKQNQLMAQVQQEVQPGNNGQVRGGYFSTRQTKVDFSRFNGKDLHGWMYRCEQFFDIDGTPLVSRVKLAAINLEGRAL